MTEEQFMTAERIVKAIRNLEDMREHINNALCVLSDNQDKDTALTLANILIDLSKKKYGRWKLDIFIDTAISDIIKHIEELRKELKEI